MFNWYSVGLISVMALVTFMIRLFPVIVFKKRTPLWVIYLGQVFPYSIMILLFLYCLKDVNWLSSNGLASLIACMAVVLVHKWRHSTILSVATGTVVYMVLVQGVLAG